MSFFTLLRPEYGRLYALLAVARVVFAFVGTGYIHPDEYFQNGEVTAGSIFGLHTLKTWEWDPSFPCRSIVPPAWSTGIAFAILNRTSDTVLPVDIFRAERASFLVLSFLLDIYMYRLVPHKPMMALTLLASTHVMLTFQLRPFSNSIEAIFLAGALDYFSKSLHSPTIGSFCRNLSALVAYFIDGVFTRITFLAFAAPIAVETMLEIADKIREGNSFRPILISAVVAAFVSYLIHVGFDSLYFLGSTENLVLTPYNFLLYNLSSKNLAQHGIHPRWLHAAVNLPMILGPSLLVAGVYAGWQALHGRRDVKENPSGDPLARMNRVCACIVLSALVLLSVQPHQEPRFLVPLVFPTVLLVANSGVIQRLGRLFWITAISFNFVLVILFGVLHQGGIVPSLFRVHELVQQTSHSSAIVYWKTYMPPRHLLAITEADVQSGQVSITDLAGADADEASDILSSLPSGEGGTDMYLVTPPFAVRSLGQHMLGCLKLDKRIFPHLDLDHLPESVEMGWREGLSLEIYVAELECIKRPVGSSP